MRRRFGVLLLTVPLLGLGPLAGGAEFQVVAHPSVEGSQVRRSVLADIYEGDVTRWGNRLRIRPVDQSTQTPVRLAFSRQVLGRSLGEIQEYWARRMATERQMPPTTKPSDEEVLAFVASKKGAIGYVTAGILLPEDVKAITIID